MEILIISGDTDETEHSSVTGNLHLHLSDDDEIVPGNLGELYQNQEADPNFNNFWFYKDND